MARFLPQTSYYFYAYAQLERAGRAANVIICVPSGDFGNITAGLFGEKMELPIRRFIIASNRNDIFYQCSQAGQYNPRPSVAIIVNTMGASDLSDFAHILDLYSDSHATIAAETSGAMYTDRQVHETVKTIWQETGYLLGPHGAYGFHASEENLQPGETGVSLETAHPAKFLQTIEAIIDTKVEILAKPQAFMKGKK